MLTNSTTDKLKSVEIRNKMNLLPNGKENKENVTKNKTVKKRDAMRLASVTYSNQFCRQSHLFVPRNNHQVRNVKQEEQYTATGSRQVSSVNKHWMRRKYRP